MKGPLKRFRGRLKLSGFQDYNHDWNYKITCANGWWSTVSARIRLKNITASPISFFFFFFNNMNPVTNYKLVTFCYIYLCVNIVWQECGLVRRRRIGRNQYSRRLFRFESVPLPPSHVKRSWKPNANTYNMIS